MLYLIIGNIRTIVIDFFVINSFQFIFQLLILNFNNIKTFSGYISKNTCLIIVDFKHKDWIS